MKKIESFLDDAALAEVMKRGQANLAKRMHETAATRKDLMTMQQEALDKYFRRWMELLPPVARPYVRIPSLEAVSWLISTTSTPSGLQCIYAPGSEEETLELEIPGLAPMQAEVTIQGAVTWWIAQIDMDEDGEPFLSFKHKMKELVFDVALARAREIHAEFEQEKRQYAEWLKQQELEPVYEPVMDEVEADDEAVLLGCTKAELAQLVRESRKTEKKKAG